jgi:hypothetical protein
LPARAGGVGDHAWDQQRRWTKKQRWRQQQQGDGEGDGKGDGPKRRHHQPPPPPLVRTDPKAAAAAADAQRYLASAPPRGRELLEEEEAGGPPSPVAAAPPALPRPPRPPSSPSRHPYATFPTQRRAFEFWDANPQRAHLRCFAVEHAPRSVEQESAAATTATTAGRGSRSFLVTSDARLWREYRHLPARHHYEIIREGSPCHLYFDLEHYYQRTASASATVDGARLVELLLDEVEASLRDVFGEAVAASLDRARDVIELDSTRKPTEAVGASAAAATPGGKFSRHLIVRVPNAAFADNAHAGAFVRLVCARLLAKAARLPSGEHAGFLVAPRGQQQGGGASSSSSSPQQQQQQLQLFIDTGVYTRNRAFRMYLSSKAPAAVAAAAPSSSSPPPPLLPTRRFGGRFAMRTPDELFFDALVTRVVVDAVVDGQGGGGGKMEAVAAKSTTTTATAAEEEGAEEATAATAPPPPAPQTATTTTTPTPQAGRLLLLLRMDTPRARELEAAAEKEAEPMARRLLTPSLSACTPFARVRVPGAVGAAAGAGAVGAAGEQQQRGRGGHDHHHQNNNNDGSSLAVLHDGPSPYGSLIAFLEDAATRLATGGGGGGGGRGPAAVARGWAHAPQARVVLTPFRAPYRWCGNVGRHHKSNGVFAIADLEAGVWYMRCYDPECAGWRSPALPLPADVWRCGAEAAAVEAGQGGEDDDEDAYYNALLDAVEAGGGA